MNEEDIGSLTKILQIILQEPSQRNGDENNDWKRKYINKLLVSSRVFDDMNVQICQWYTILDYGRGSSKKFVVVGQPAFKECDTDFSLLFNRFSPSKAIMPLKCMGLQGMKEN